MAEIRLREMQGKEQGEPKKPVPPEGAAGSRPVQGRAEAGARAPETAPDDKALLEALRQFVRREHGESGAEAPAEAAKVGFWQGVVLVVFAADLALGYSVVDHWLENPLPQEILKVVPWVLGATAVGFADKVRLFLIRQAGHLTWAIPALAILLVGFVPFLPLFSIRVRLTPGTAEISRDSHFEVHRTADADVSRLSFPALKAYPVSVTDTGSNPADAVAFKPTLGWRMIARGTLAQIPALGSLFGPREIALSPLYRVKVNSPEIGANPKVLISGTFSSLFLGSTECQLDRNHKPAPLVCDIQEGEDAVDLPAGDYEFTLVQKDCRRIIGKKHVSAGKNDRIDSRSIPCTS